MSTTPITTGNSLDQLSYPETTAGVDIYGIRGGKDYRIAVGVQGGIAEHSRLLTIEQGQQAGMIGFATKADMDADLAHDANTLALVTNDATAENNGGYRKLGASGGGSWLKATDRVTGVESRVSQAEIDIAELELLNTTASARAEAIEESLSGLADLQPDQGVGQNLVWGVGDADGRMAVAVSDDGRVLLGGSEYPVEGHPYDGQDLWGGLDLAWGVIDASGRAAMGVDASGRALIEGDTYPVEMHPYNGGDSFAFGFIDAAGNLLFGLTEDGAVFAPTLELATVEPVASVDGEDAQPIVYSKPYDPGTGARETLYLVDGEGESRLTDGSFDALHPQVVKNRYVKYASDRDGSLHLWRATLDGSMEVRGHDGVLRHHLYYGQSNSQMKGIAGSFTGALTSAPPMPFSALMFNGGVAPNHTGDAETWDNTAQAAAIPAGNMLRAVDLDLYAVDVREAHAFGLAEMLYAGSPGLTLHSLHGVGGASYMDLRKGSQPYANVVAAVEAGKAVATELGLRYEVAAVHFFHGEADFNNVAYQAALEQLCTDLRADIATATDQQSAARVLITQVANWCYSPGSQATALSPLAQLAAHEAGALELVTPTYHVQHDNGLAPGDKIHVAAYGVRMLAEKFAQAALVPSWEPLRPTTVVASDTTIVVSFTGRVGSLQFNEYEATTNPNGVVDPGNKGFELLNGGGVAITGVAIVNGGTQVEISCSGVVPADAELAYAYTGIPDTIAGPIEGPRGCLSDSDPTLPSAVIQSHRTVNLGQSGVAAAAPLVNWCVAFRKAID